MRESVRSNWVQSPKSGQFWVKIDGPGFKWTVQNDIKWTVYESGRPTKNETGRLQKCVGGQKRMKVDGTQNCLGNLKKMKVDGLRNKKSDFTKRGRFKLP